MIRPDAIHILWKILLKKLRLKTMEGVISEQDFMSFLPSTKAMVGIAAAGGLVIGVTGLNLHSRLQSKIKQHTYVRQSLKILRQHEGAKYLLGTPIKDFNADLAQYQDNYTTEEEARFKVGVSGSKGEGWLILNALRQVYSESIYSIIKIF